MTVTPLVNQFDAIEKYFLNSFSEYRKMGLHHIAMILILDGMIEKFKSIEVLLDNRQIDGINILERSILESSVSLNYILESTHKYARQRGRAFYFNSKVQSGKKAKAIINQHPFGLDADELRLQLKYVIEKQHHPNYDNIDGYITYYKSMYEQCFNLVDVTGKERKNQIKNWFNQNGSLKSIYHLFCYLGREDEYRVFYANASMDVHGANVISNGIIKDGVFSISHSVEPHVIETQCVYWILTAIKSISHYLGVDNKQNVILQINLIEKNWKNEVFRQQRNKDL
ncbi:hypothetical protein IMAU80057_02617 [Lactiplantibacillus plantarum]|uniref:DUF5677 domain-containing protein n=2 Tax=Lactiplantibacillus plantarum TaxID=1590 RepID=UPI003523E266|nr:hypothetical protein [Lactiplantibacillus plantarum]